MRNKRLLLVMIGPPLPFGTGAMGKWYYVLLRGLVARGYDVTAFATCTTREEVEQTQGLFSPPGYDVRCYLPEEATGVGAKWRTLRHPYSSPLTPHLKRDFRAETARGFDILHLEVLWSGWLGLSQAERAVVNVPYLYQIDLADQPPRSVTERILRHRTFRAERFLLRRYPTVSAVSPRLATRIREISPRADVHAIPFGLDLSLYPLLDRGASGDRAPTIGLVAAFHWTPGYTAGMRLLRRLWPEIKQRVPNAKLKLAGIYARTAFRDHLDLPDVEVQDHVSDVREFFCSIDLQLYPPNPSSGMKFKVLESFAFGVPVVTNAAGVEGIPAKDGVHAGVCEDDAGMIERTVALLRSPELRERRRVAARALLEEHCGEERVLGEFEKIYRRIAPQSQVSRTSRREAARPHASTNSGD